MGIDWEEILGAEGEDIADAYEEHVTDTDESYVSSALFGTETYDEADDLPDEEEEDWDGEYLQFWHPEVAGDILEGREDLSSYTVNDLTCLKEELVSVLGDKERYQGVKDDVYQAAIDAVDRALETKIAAEKAAKEKEEEEKQRIAKEYAKEYAAVCPADDEEPFT